MVLDLHGNLKAYLKEKISIEQSRIRQVRVNVINGEMQKSLTCLGVSFAHTLATTASTLDSTKHAIN
jgi:hypothetical protein